MDGARFFSRALRVSELERCESVTFILPRHCLAVLIIFAGRGGDPPFLWGMASIPEVQQLSYVRYKGNCHVGRRYYPPSVDLI